MMWFLLLLLHTAHIELIISEAGDKLILRNRGDNPCEGHVEVYHNNIWGYVGDAYWSKNTEKVVCKSTHCGEPEPTSTKDVLKPLENRMIWLNELKCKGTESALWNCDGPGWNASVYQKLTVKKLSCPRNITISLDGSKCAGAVKYSDGENSGYFCSSGWNSIGAGLVCKSLGCGGVRKINPPQWMESETFISSNMNLDCSAFQNQEPDNLWQCVTGKHSWKPDKCKPASVICEGHQRLQLKGNRSNVCSGQLEEEKNGAWEPVRQNNSASDVCQRMHCGTTRNINETNNGLHVTCTDVVKVVLMDADAESQCYGTVHIKVNGSTWPVCASSWTENLSEFVCKKLDCEKLISFTRETGKSGAVMDHVVCNGSESSLWHCQALRDKNLECSSRTKVVCSGSVEMKLVDGPGKYSGRLAVKFEGKWRRVANTSWTDKNSATVCKQLGYGSKGKTETFSQGSANFLHVDCEGKQEPDIFKCLKDNPSTSSPEEQAVGITCENHMVVFLKGNEACSGHVGIKHDSNTYWLSGSKVTWNQMAADTVCQQMQCGNATSFTYHNITVHKDGRVWNESHSCSSKEKSLFDCKKISSPPPDHQNSTAYVECSGKIVMNLTKGCWGKVKVYTEEVEGDVCADTWTEEKSHLLCKSLDCGIALKAHKGRRDGDIRFNSVNATLGQNGTLTEWNLVRTTADDKSCTQRPAYVVCSGSVESRFSNSNDSCFGNIDMAYEGQWIPVCSDALEDANTRNTICRKLKCGDAAGLLPYFGPAPTGTQAISSLKCSADANSSLSACEITTSPNKCNYTGLQCADWKMMVTAGNMSCSGTVLVHSGKGIRAVSSQGWTEIEKERLCQDMNCGGFSSNTTEDQGIEINTFWDKSFSCAINTERPVRTIWDCEKHNHTKHKTRPSEEKALFIKCQREPNVSLSNGCHGDVRIDNKPVCIQNSDQSSAHKVCQEKHCGNAMTHVMTQSQTSSDIYHVSCDKYHTNIGQCRRIKGRAPQKSSIFCSESVKFRTTQQNGGVLEVNYRDKWEKVCQTVKLSQSMTDRLCEEIKKVNHGNQNQQGKSETTLECTDNIRDIKRCVKRHSCGSLPLIEIFCPGYVTPAPTLSPPERPPTAPIIVGVALLLLVLILIGLFIRFCVRRARKSKMSSRALSTKDMEFESGEYEDVMNKENEMEDFSPGRFRSEDEFITENDGHSVSSVPYDDIDEADEARPLTSPGPAAPADRDPNMHEDGVTYEVENPQESYDDIDTILETTQTKAEVHDSPQTTHDTAAPPGLAQGDDDYLEPDQDG